MVQYIYIGEFDFRKHRDLLTRTLDFQNWPSFPILNLEMKHTIIFKAQFYSLLYCITQSASHTFLGSAWNTLQRYIDICLKIAGK